MAVTAIQNSSQTATIGTEHVLGTAVVTAGVYVLVVDTTNLALGDTLELRIYTKITSGSTEHQTYCASYSNPQSDAHKLSVPVPEDASWKATLKQTAGTGRVFPWKILSL